MAKKKNLLLSAPKPRLHIRRCHLCGTTNERDGGEVKACVECGKHMAPFYFFNDQDVVLHSDFGLRPERPSGKVRPVIGFTAYW